MIRITEAKREEAIWISSRLRPEDIREIGVSGRTPEYTTPVSFDISEECYTVRGTEDDDPIAMYGVADDPNDVSMGVVWLLATSRMSTISRAFLRAAPKLLRHLGANYTRGLHNNVDSRNTLHIRWLQKTGFTPEGTVQCNGFKFIHAVRYHQRSKLSV